MTQFFEISTVAYVFFFICLVTKFKTIGHHSMVNSPSPSGDFSFSFTVQFWMDRDHYPLTLPLSLTFFSVKKKKKKKNMEGREKNFFGSGLFSELEPNGPICWTEPKLPTPIYNYYSICVTSSKRRRGRENCMEGVTREYPAGALRQWFNCQFPQGISFPPDLFLFFSSALYFRLFSLWIRICMEYVVGGCD